MTPRLSRGHVNGLSGGEVDADLHQIDAVRSVDQFDRMLPRRPRGTLDDVREAMPDMHLDMKDTVAKTKRTDALCRAFR